MVALPAVRAFMVMVLPFKTDETTLALELLEIK
jgi:hypothetical protein